MCRCGVLMRPQGGAHDRGSPPASGARPGVPRHFASQRVWDRKPARERRLLHQ